MCQKCYIFTLINYRKTLYNIEIHVRDLCQVNIIGIRIVKAKTKSRNIPNIRINSRREIPEVRNIKYYLHFKENSPGIHLRFKIG